MFSGSKHEVLRFSSGNETPTKHIQNISARQVAHPGSKSFSFCDQGAPEGSPDAHRAAFLEEKSAGGVDEGRRKISRKGIVMEILDRLLRSDSYGL